MTVTTGARAALRAAAPRPLLEEGFGVVQLGGEGLVAHFPTTIIAVSWSSCWLMVTIWPSFIIA